MKKDVLITEISELVRPVVEELGYELYHVEYVKENGEFYLRIYIDNENGISLVDCEKVSRRISDIVDEKDPIKEQYFLEVSSPGIFRELFEDSHLLKHINDKVRIKLKKPVEKKKEYIGELLSFDESIVKMMADGKELEFLRENIKSINLEGEI